MWVFMSCENYRIELMFRTKNAVQMEAVKIMQNWVVTVAAYYRPCIFSKPSKPREGL